MDNKELPQEIVNEISNAIMVHNNPNATKKIVAVVKSHYLKELQAKDTTIKGLETELERVKGLLKNMVYREHYNTIYDIYRNEETADTAATNEVEDFCKSNNINS